MKTYEPPADQRRPRDPAKGERARGGEFTAETAVGHREAGVVRALASIVTAPTRRMRRSDGYRPGASPDGAWCTEWLSPLMQRAEVCDPLWAGGLASELTSRELSSQRGRKDRFACAGRPVRIHTNCVERITEPLVFRP